MLNLSNLFKKSEETSVAENKDIVVNEELDAERYADADCTGATIIMVPEDAVDENGKLKDGILDENGNYIEDGDEEEDEYEDEKPYNLFDEAFKNAEEALEAKELSFEINDKPFFVFALETVYGTAYLLKTKFAEDLEDLKCLIKFTPVEITENLTTLKKTDKETNLAVYTDGTVTDIENVIIPVLSVGEFLVSELREACQTIDSLKEEYAPVAEKFEWPKIYFTVLPSWKKAVVNKYVYANTSFYVYEDEDSAKNNYYSKRWLKNGGKIYKCQVAKNDIKVTFPEFSKVAADVLMFA